MHYYVGPLGLNYNDENYSSQDGIIEVVEVFTTREEAQAHADALTCKAIRAGHEAYEYWAEYGEGPEDITSLSDNELLKALDNDKYGSVPQRLFGVING